MKPRNFGPLRRALARGPAIRIKSGKQVFWQIGGRRKFSCEAVNALIAAGEAARIEDRVYSLKQLEDELCRTFIGLRQQTFENVQSSRRLTTWKVKP